MERNGLGQREKEVRECRRLTGETKSKEWIGKGMVKEGKGNLEARMSECEKICVEGKGWVKTVIRPESLWTVEKLQKGVKRGRCGVKYTPSSYTF